jgi:hypothetical protein
MSKLAFMLLGVISLTASCATEVVLSGRVGPSPYRAGTTAHTGCLQVFSGQEQISEGFDEGANPTYYEYSDYRVYDMGGRMVKYVSNSVGKYNPVPRLVSLPPGNYIVKARAKDYLVVRVPVVIQSGRTTRVHLNADWKPPAGVNANELVIEPNGNSVGWRVHPSSQHAKTLQGYLRGVG